MKRNAMTRLLALATAVAMGRLGGLGVLHLVLAARVLLGRPEKPA